MACVEQPLVCMSLAHRRASTSPKRKTAAPIVKHSISARPQRIGMHVVVRTVDAARSLSSPPPSSFDGAANKRGADGRNEQPVTPN
jgi:hypothetical protein